MPVDCQIQAGYVIVYAYPGRVSFFQVDCRTGTTTIYYDRVSGLAVYGDVLTSPTKNDIWLET